MDKIIVIGGKGTAVVVGEQIYDAQLKGSKLEFLGYAFDDEEFGDNINGFPIITKTYQVYEKYKRFQDVKFIFQLYRADLMKERIRLLTGYGIPKDRFFTFVHPSAMIANSASIEPGTCILANTVVNSNAKIGSFCTVNSNSLIGHDTIIGDYNFIAAHSAIGSSSSIGKGNFIGLNSSINNYLEIGDYNFIGMSSNVIKGFGSNKKLYGNPAKEFFSEIKPL